MPELDVIKSERLLRDRRHLYTYGTKPSEVLARMVQAKLEDMEGQLGALEKGVLSLETTTLRQLSILKKNLTE